jgi:threonyl-tRNA synthetase
MAFLIEHYAGNFPLWLSPTQVAVIPVADAHLEYATTINAQLRSADFRSELYDSNDSMGKKIRQAKKERVPYFIVIGDKEVETNTVTLESRDSDESVILSLDALIVKLSDEVRV